MPETAMKIDPNAPAYPKAGNKYDGGGMTIRTQIAAMDQTMPDEQWMRLWRHRACALARRHNKQEPSDSVGHAAWRVERADALIAELNNAAE